VLPGGGSGGLDCRKRTQNELNRSALSCQLSGFINQARWALFVPAF
jgi:hypothetical protein